MKWFSKFIFSLPILWGLGCGEDPILQQARDAEKQPQDSVSTTKKELANKNNSAKIPTIAPPKNNDVQKKKLDLPTIAPPDGREPERVQEGEPPPQPEKKNSVSFEGTISVQEWSGKPIRIDVFDGDQRNIGGKRPSVIFSEKIDSTGDFLIKIPQEDINVWIGAYIDEDLDGRPGPKDPSGWYAANPLSSAQNQSGIVISLGLPDQPNPE